MKETAGPLKGVPKCLHRGAATGRTVRSDESGARLTSLPVFACAVRGECTERLSAVPDLVTCRVCPDAQEPGQVDGLPPESQTIRHLGYHIYPIHGNGAWEWNVDELCKRMHLFNGRKVVAIAVDPPGRRKPDPSGGSHCPDRDRFLAGCARPETVMRRFGSHAADIEFVVEENDPNLREVKTFESIFSRLETTEPGHVAMYGHAKGATRRTGHLARIWTETIIEVCLDYWPLVYEHLCRWSATGPFLKRGPSWRPEDTNSDWHYSGSWFWFRCADLFRKPDWRRIDRFWTGIEPYPSQHFPFRVVGCLFHPGRSNSVNLYSADYWKRAVLPDLAGWRVRNSRKRKVW